MRRITAGGSSVLFVSYDLDEVREITDRVTVLRDGRTSGTVETAEASGRDLIKMIVGHDLADHVSDVEAAPTGKDVVLSVRDLRGDFLTGIDFDLREGEIRHVRCGCPAPSASTCSRWPARTTGRRHSRPVHAACSTLAPPTAAYVIGRRGDVPAWNAAAAALFRHLTGGPRRPNNVRCVFAGWADIASDSAAHLRASAGHRPDDHGPAALMAELEKTAPDFRRLWAARELRHKVSGRKHLNHPVIGRVTLDYDVLAVPDSPGQRLVAYSAAPGTPSHAALTRLVAPTTE